MEAWGLQPEVDYAVACFWYGLPGATDNIHPDSTTILRKLRDFNRPPAVQQPGEIYADPAANRQLAARATGNIRYAGNQPDLLEWRAKEVAKPLDADKDNILGSAGYCFFGSKMFNLYGHSDYSDKTLPPFIIALAPQQVTHSGGGAYISLPGDSMHSLSTGLIAVKDSVAKAGLVSFTVGKGAPAVFRLGIMTDNAAAFEEAGSQLWVTNEKNETSGKVLLIKSNRFPDWYFFDLEAKEGDVITIHGSTGKEGGIFSIGGLTFDVNK
jgi:hypothetical protein